MTLHIENPERIPADFCVFYCWQDHLDPSLNRFLIRDSLNRAIADVQQELPDTLDCSIRLDQATDGRAGSVDIANVILEKIRDCSMVVADVTPVLKDVENGRYYPNPNVMLELGYAARSRGWHRINCLFNFSHAGPEQLPFDIRHRRVSGFRCGSRGERAEARNRLTQLLVSAIRATILSVDRGEIDETIGNDQIRHARDLRVVRELMQTIHRPTLDYYVERGQVRQLHYDCIYFWHGFNALVTSSFFQLYDDQLERLVLRLHESWEAAVYHGSYAFGPGVDPSSLVLQPEHLWNDAYEATVNAMDRAYSDIPGALSNVLNHVHARYLEIDMDETDRIAYQAIEPYLGGELQQSDSGSSEDESSDTP